MPHIDAAVCSQCGICLGICDNFANDEVGVVDLVQRAIYLEERFGFVCFCCEDTLFEGFDPALNVISLPCLASLPPQFWILLSARNLDVRVYLDRVACENCPRSAPAALPLWDYVSRVTEETTGRALQITDDVPEKANLVTQFMKAGTLDRRSLVPNALEGAEEIANGDYARRTSDASLEARLRREKMRAQGRVRRGDCHKDLPSQLAARVSPPKRLLEESIVQAAPDIAARMARLCSVTDARLCDNCAEPTGKSFACTVACPTNARRIDHGTETLSFARVHCIGCGLCVATCPHHAITLEQTTLA